MFASREPSGERALDEGSYWMDKIIHTLDSRMGDRGWTNQIDGEKAGSLVQAVL